VLMFLNTHPARSGHSHAASPLVASMEEPTFRISVWFGGTDMLTTREPESAVNWPFSNKTMLPTPFVRATEDVVNTSQRPAGPWS